MASSETSFEIPEFDRVWAEQEDLDRLTAARRPRVREAYWPNANYGFTRVLKQYAGYPMHLPVFGVIPHGVYLAGDQKLFEGERDAPVPAAFTYPDYVDEVFRRQSRKTVIPSASPFLYALALMKGHFADVEKRGTLFFPEHSTAGVRIKADLNKAADDLVSLPEEYHPIRVCMHWYDYSIGLHEPFTERGFELVSAGHFQDDDFLFRLIHLLWSHRYAAGNGLGSTPFYVTAIGMPFFLLDPDTVNRTEARVPRPRASRERQRENYRIRRLFGTMPPAVDDERQSIADKLLGWDRMKPPDGLRSDLELAASLTGRRRS